MAVANLAVPFPALSGMGLDQSDQNGLGQQLWHLVAAELPVSTLCDADGCVLTAPTSPITGISGVDALLWPLAILTGLVKFPIIDSWLKVPLRQLVSGYTFGPDYPGYADPSGPAYPGFGFPGTTVDPETGENLMPFANTTFNLDLSKPFRNYFNHLIADPSTNPIRLPNLVDFGRSLQALLAGLVMASDPTTPGSPFCPGTCGFLPAGLDYPGIVKSIAAVWPGNPLLEGPDGWLTAYENGTANGPTQEQIEHSVQILQPDRWDFGNASPPTSTTSTLDAEKPNLTDDGKKLQPRKVSGNHAPRDGLAGAANATLDKSRSSRSPNPGEALNGPQKVNGPRLKSTSATGAGTGTGNVDRSAEADAPTG